MRRGQDPLPIGRRRAGGEGQPGRVLRHVVRHRGRRHHHHDGNSNDDTETVAAGPGREKAGHFFGEVEWQSNFIPLQQTRDKLPLIRTRNWWKIFKYS